MYEIWETKYGKQIADEKLEEWKIKMNTPERKKKISKAMKGRVFSEETKNKMSQARNGKSSNAKGKIWIHKEKKNKMILPDIFQEYENYGWLKGRFKK
jgi:hypothetical protein